jgi:hypothetical protein
VGIGGGDMLFPKLTFETILQVDEKTRLDASLSFATEDENITDVLIEPESGAGFVSVYNSGNTSKWHLDWAYELDGMKDVSIRIEADSGNKTKTYIAGVNVLTEDEDALLSSDNDLIPYEPDILNYLPKGKNSYIYAHRKAQERILSFLDEQRIWRSDSSIYTKQDLVDLPSEFAEQFRQWSTFQTLLIIFESIQVNSADIFQEKKQEYENLMRQARNRSSLRLDQNNDGELEVTPYNIRTTRLVRR